MVLGQNTGYLVLNLRSDIKANTRLPVCVKSQKLYLK